MTTSSEQKDNTIKRIMEALIENGVDAFGPAVEELINKSMKAERSEFLNA